MSHFWKKVNGPSGEDDDFDMVMVKDGIVGRLIRLWKRQDIYTYTATKEYDELVTERGLRIIVGADRREILLTDPDAIASFHSRCPKETWIRDRVMGLLTDDTEYQRQLRSVIDQYSGGSYGGGCSVEPSSLFLADRPSQPDDHGSGVPSLLVTKYQVQQFVSLRWITASAPSGSSEFAVSRAVQFKDQHPDRPVRVVEVIDGKPGSTIYSQ